MKINDNNYPTIIIIGFALANLYVILYLLIFIDIPELFGKAFEIGQLFYNLSLSFIAASLFYFIVDFYPKRERKKALLDTVKIHLTRIEGTYNTILKNLNYEGERFSVMNISRDDLERIMTSTTLDYKTNENSLHKKNITIVELFKNKKGIIDKELSDLEKYVDLYSTELYACLVDFKRFDVIDVLRNVEFISNAHGVPLQNLKPVSNMFFEQILKYRELKIEWEKNRMG